jgi:hypothetical protein
MSPGTRDTEVYLPHIERGYRKDICKRAVSQYSQAQDPVASSQNKLYTISSMGIIGDDVGALELQDER